MYVQYHGIIRFDIERFLYFCLRDRGNPFYVINEMIEGEIHILPTYNTPEFIFKNDGTIIIRGRALLGNRTKVSDKLINWIEQYITDPAEITYVVLNFEYLNSFSTTILVSILRKLSLVILQSKKLVIHWYYEEGDDDILERGEYISESFNIPIEFIRTS